MPAQCILRARSGIFHDHGQLPRVQPGPNELVWCYGGLLYGRGRSWSALLCTALPPGAHTLAELEHLRTGLEVAYPSSRGRAIHGSATRGDGYSCWEYTGSAVFLLVGSAFDAGLLLKGHTHHARAIGRHAVTMGGYARHTPSQRALNKSHQTPCRHDGGLRESPLASRPQHEEPSDAKPSRWRAA